jgi:hypothetical protein
MSLYKLMLCTHADGGDVDSMLAHAIMILSSDDLPFDDLGSGRPNNEPTGSAAPLPSAGKGRLLSKETLDALDELGIVLRRVYGEMVSEGYTLEDGEIRLARPKSQNDST